MRCFRTLRSLAVLTAALGMLLPAAVLRADAGSTASEAEEAGPAVPVADVALDARGSLLGVVVSVDGVPMKDATVTLHRGDKPLARAVTDGLGRFTLPKVEGGVYQLSAGRYATLVRTWAPGTAPPHAKPLALLLTGEDVIRGQMPAGQFFASDAFVFVTVAGAIVSVPLIVEATEDSPVSP